MVSVNAIIDDCIAMRRNKKETKDIFFNLVLKNEFAISRFTCLSNRIEADLQEKLNEYLEKGDFDFREIPKCELVASFKKKDIF